MSAERFAELRARAAADAWDADAAAALVSAAAQMRADEGLAVLRDAAERFPTAARVWRLRVEALQRAPPADADAADAADGVKRVRDMLEAAVAAAPVAVELWRDYARWVNATGSPAGVEPTAVFERGVASAGLDQGANMLWSDYVNYLKKTDSLSESQRRDALRKVYQRALRVPMQDLEMFWTQYRHFEETTNVNKELGRGLLADAQPRYQAARAEWRSRRIRREGLALNTWPVPPKGRPKEATQAAQWRRFITTERSNPHMLDRGQLFLRVVHAYETALVPLYRYPDVWIDYLAYVADVAMGKNNDPQDAAASAAAARGGGKGGGRGSQGGANSLPADNGVAPAKMDDFQKLAERAMRALPSCVALFNHIAWIWNREAKTSKALSTLESLVKSNPSPLAYVHLMRLTRKVSGKDAARKVFAKARRDTKGAGPAVYVAAAQMEFVINKDNKVARNVFEFGLKHYAKSALMVREFVEWLWGLGDFDHLRVVLKRVMPTIEGPPELVRGLWERWVELEEAVGDVASVESVEKLWREADSGSGSRAQSVVSDAVRRSRFLSLNGLREEELAVLTGVAGISTLTAAGGSSRASVNGGSVGGRRDPRTGRLVGTSSRGSRATDSGTGATASGANGSRGASSHGSKVGSESGGHGSGKQGGDRSGSSAERNTPLATGSGFDSVEANLRRLSSGLRVINAPAPDYETIAALLLSTPSSYADTPVGGAPLNTSGTTGGDGHEVGGGERGSVGGLNGRISKKRSGEDLMGGSKQSQATHGPPQDLFRARQAAKQSRLR